MFMYGIIFACSGYALISNLAPTVSSRQFSIFGLIKLAFTV